MRRENCRVRAIRRCSSRIVVRHIWPSRPMHRRRPPPGRPSIRDRARLPSRYIKCSLRRRPPGRCILKSRRCPVVRAANRAAPRGTGPEQRMHETSLSAASRTANPRRKAATRSVRSKQRRRRCSWQGPLVPRPDRTRTKTERGRRRTRRRPGAAARRCSPPPDEGRTARFPCAERRARARVCAVARDVRRRACIGATIAA